MSRLPPGGSAAALFLEGLEALGVTRRQCDQVCERFLETFGDVRFGDEEMSADVRLMMMILVGASGEVVTTVTTDGAMRERPAATDDFPWPLVDMASFEYRHPEVDIKKTVVVTGMPRKRGSEGIGAMKALLIKMLRPKSVFLPKEATCNTTRGTGFLEFATAADANRAVEVLGRFAWPVRGLLSELHDNVTFVHWDARLFRHYCKAPTSKRGSKPPGRGPSTNQSTEEREEQRGLLLAVQARNAALEERLAQAEMQIEISEKRAAAAEKLAHEWASVMKLDSDDSIDIAAIGRLASLSQGTLTKLALRDNGGLLKAQADLQCTLVRLQSALQWEEQQRREQLEVNTCCICRECPKTILLLPCRHLCVCESCAHRAARSSCPVCRRVVDEQVRVFVS